MFSTLICHILPKGFMIKPNELIISNITRDLQGTYKCLAQNGLEQNAWRVIELDVRCK